MGFELFDKMSRSFKAKISIRNNGNIGFGKGAVNKFNLTGQNYCKLYYDTNRKYIGFEFVEKDVPGVTAKVVSRGLDMFVSVRSFLNYYNIKFDKTRVYQGQMDEESRMIFIDLTKPEYESKRKTKEK